MRPTLMQVTKKLYAELWKIGIAPSIYDCRRWQTLYYLFSYINGPWSYLFDDMKFDWDGHYPVSQELSEILDSFGMVCSAGNYHVDDLIIEYWISEWSSNDDDSKSMVSQLVKLATELLQQYSSDYVHSHQSTDYPSYMLFTQRG